MKTIILGLIAAAAMFITAGGEEEHEHHGYYGGAYDGNYHEYGHNYAYPSHWTVKIGGIEDKKA